MDELIDELYKYFNTALSNIEKADIINIQKGFINNNCNILLLNIITNCMSNVDIFTNEQLDNLGKMIEKLIKDGE